MLDKGEKLVNGERMKVLGGEAFGRHARSPARLGRFLHAVDRFHPQVIQV